MKYRKFFIHALQNHYSADWSRLLNDVDHNFSRILPDIRFSITSANPIDRRLHFCGYFLALIKTLDQRNMRYDQIRIVCLDVVTEYVRPRNALQRWLKRIPSAIIQFKITKPLLRVFAKRIQRPAHPDGFAAKLITDRSKTFGLGYGIDITECGICKLFEKHNYRKYASILCEVDKLTSAFAGLELIRQGTIANGAEICDFRFKKAKPTDVATVIEAAR